MTAASRDTDEGDAAYWLNSEGGDKRTRDSMGAISNWQSTIKLCISSQESSQHSSNQHSDPATGNWQLAISEESAGALPRNTRIILPVLDPCLFVNSRLPSLDLRQSAEICADVILLTADCSQLSVTLSACELLSNG
jgi:hypothetical protein